MKKVICKSAGESILFTDDFPFFLENITGISEISGDVSSIKQAYAIGEDYIDTSVNKRNILISGIVVDNFIENRDKLYKIFPLRAYGTLFYYEKNVKRKIDYQVENIRFDEQGFPRKFDISLICPYPYFTDIEPLTYQMATWTPLFEFPLYSDMENGFEFGSKNLTSMAKINNSTNITSGMTIIFKANDTVINPSLFNVDTREEIKIEKTMNSGDEIIVTTKRGDKNIYFVSSLTGVLENINYLMEYGSKFLQIYPGENVFRYNAENGVNNLECVIEYYTEYEAI